MHDIDLGADSEEEEGTPTPTDSPKPEPAHVAALPLAEKPLSSRLKRASKTQAQERASQRPCTLVAKLTNPQVITEACLLLSTDAFKPCVPQWELFLSSSEFMLYLLGVTPAPATSAPSAACKRNVP